MRKGAGRPKAEMAGATTTKKATKAKAAAGGQAKTATKAKTTAKTESKTAAKQSVSAAVKMPVSSPVLRHARKSARREAAMGGTVAKKKAVATPSKPEIDLPDQSSTVPFEEIEMRIRLRAYELWERGGREHGREREHWLEAENEIADTLSKAVRTRPGKATRVPARKKVK